MTDTVITVENLSKRYLVGHQSAQRERYTALRDVIAREARNFARKTADFVRGRQILEGDDVEEFWALKDVSFEVKRGEVLGVIGQNGAGKSTLLKILSRITDPTEGRVRLRGRVASLLEVGTGFHPELTGRENIYLNGAILGMTRAEIKREFDEIVAFAGVERFLDTPVKRYSSGMYLRLAFSVAAHLRTDTLVVDEVLAVGDAEFQKKCLSRISDLAHGGRTVLFVSHNLGAIRALTQRCIVLRAGRLVTDGPPGEAIEHYLKHSASGIEGGIFCRGETRPAIKPFFVQKVTLRDAASAEPASNFDCDNPVYVSVDYVATRQVSGLYGYMVLQRSDGTVLYEGDSYDAGNNPLENVTAGEGTLRIKIPPRILGAGSYQLYLSFASLSDPAGIDIDTPGIVGEFNLDDAATRRGNRRGGYLSMILKWEMAAVSERLMAVAGQ